MKKFAPLASLAGLVAAVTPAFAVDGVSVPAPSGFQITDLGLFISKAISVALVIAAILVFVYLVWGGLQWITSGGDKGKTEEARNRITAALVGLAIVACAWALIQLISSFFGIDIVNGAKNMKAY